MKLFKIGKKKCKDKDLQDKVRDMQFFKVRDMQFFLQNVRNEK